MEEEKRTRIPFWKALGTEKEVSERRPVWVLFQDAIARIQLSGFWTVSRRGPRMFDQLSELKDVESTSELHVMTRDGVLSLQRNGVQGFGEGEIRVDGGMIVGERVEQPNDPTHVHDYIDIVRVTR